MNKILSNIRTVPGVWGTLAIDKKRALTYQLLPARYDSQIVKDIAIPTLNLAQTSEKPMVVDFFFESGKARMYSSKEAAVLVLGREEMNFDMLNAVCREALTAINRKFSKGEFGGSNSIQSYKTDSAGFEFMLKAVNILAYNAQRKIGSYLVTKHLRGSKDEIVEKYPFFTSITVDNNGVANLIKGFPPYDGEDLMNAFAHWANLFVSKCASSSSKLNQNDIIELTLEIKNKLELAGFYQLYSGIGSSH
jgi:hypothetical protein